MTDQTNTTDQTDEATPTPDGGVAFEYPEGGGIIVYTRPRWTPAALVRAGDQYKCGSAGPDEAGDDGCGQWHTVTSVEGMLTFGLNGIGPAVGIPQALASIKGGPLSMGIRIVHEDGEAQGEPTQLVLTRERIVIDLWNVDTLDRTEQVINALAGRGVPGTEHMRAAAAAATAGDTATMAEHVVAATNAMTPERVAAANAAAPGATNDGNSNPGGPPA